MKQGILVASFGTTHLDTLEDTIVATEQQIRRAFPGIPVYRAFTSRIVRQRLEWKHGIHVEDVPGAIARMRADGADLITVQPTLLIPGEEYDRLGRWLREAARGVEIRLGRPLLYDNADTRWLVQVLQRAYPVERDTLLMFMGHGTEHQANDFYILMAEKMRRVPSCIMRLCTVVGEPNFRDGAAEARALGLKRALLVPLMLAAGDHAQNDMAGPQAQSLRSLLMAEGYRVECRMQGLGMLPEIRERFVQRIREANPDIA